MSRGVVKGGNKAPLQTNARQIKDNTVITIKKNRKTTFEDSVWFDKNKFSEDSPADWDRETKAHWYNQALSYSQANGGMYINWMSAVKSWHRKSPYVSVGDTGKVVTASYMRGDE